ncbi:MAG: hypothetical protein K8M05_31415 [Deltaproteobacteria bacterium]|nr:hypothetical protein [Kofleriaceae bacterium]
MALVAMVGGLVMGCVEPEPPLGETAQALTAPGGQGSHYQGSHYQGSHYQGSHYQGSHYQGATLGGVTLASGTELYQDRALAVWRVLRTYPRQHEQRLPDRVCTWNESRTTLHGCTTVNLATSVSPLANVAFKASFVRDGVTLDGWVRIANRVGAVAQDTSYAMHPMSGSSAIRWPGQLMPTVCGYVAFGRSGCDNPSGCRRNCDLFTYELELVEPDGTVRSFCPAGERAYAVPGTYAANGELDDETDTHFTFACAGGTIAKCTWWGYRGFGSAKKTDGVAVDLVGYHRPCVRAAAADYCANGHSFTKNGTLVDVYDYEGTVAGLVPRTRQDNDPTKSAFVLEAYFDRYGANQLDGLRFQEQGGFDALDAICPDTFADTSDDDVGGLWQRIEAWDGEAPHVKIDTTTWCEHTERTVGKWLHPRCSACVIAVSGHPDYAYCSDPASPVGWNGACAQRAGNVCAGIASHGECATGAPLGRYASGCTARVCGTSGYAYCCSSSWDSACVAKATAICPTYKVHGITQKFCPLIVQPPPDLIRL